MPKICSFRQFLVYRVHITESTDKFKKEKLKYCISAFFHFKSGL